MFTLLFLFQSRNSNDRLQILVRANIFRLSIFFPFTIHVVRIIYRDAIFFRSFYQSIASCLRLHSNLLSFKRKSNVCHHHNVNLAVVQFVAHLHRAKQNESKRSANLLRSFLHISLARSLCSSSAT